MAMRIPVIASSINGVPDVLPEKAGCAFFNTGDVNSLAEQMENFLTNHSNWHGWKAAVRSHVTLNHALPRLAAESILFYRSLIEN
jgi:glycosyltransferase involved in cell wall biosynthesis